MRFSWIVGLLGVLGWLTLPGVGAVARGQAVPQRSKYQQQLAKLLIDKATKASERELAGLATAMKMIAMSHGRFLLDGVVMDKQGKPLRGVRLTYPKGASLEEMAKAEIDYLKTGHSNLGFELQTDVIQGIFHVDITGFSDVELVFSCPGYYDQKVVASNKPSQKEIQAFWARPQLSWIDVKKTLRVVLEKQGKLTKLEERQVVLEVTATGQNKGLQLALPGRAAGPRPRLLLEVQRQPDGTIAAGPVPRPRAPDMSDVLPQGLKLKLQGIPGDGLQRFVPMGERPVPRQMKTAPPAGYQTELPLTTEEVRGFNFYHEPVHFYFRAGGFYGRGRYEGFRLAEDHSQVAVYLTLEIQPDGTRNLETGE